MTPLLKRSIMRILLAFYSLLALHSCKSHEQLISVPIYISKSPCMVRCPEYNVQINTNRTLTFVGELNTKYIGTTTVELKKEELERIEEAFKKINWSTVEKAYDQTLYDYPQTNIIYGEKKTSYKRAELIPENLKDFVTIIDEILIAKNLK